MTTPPEPTAAEREEQLGALRKRMGKLLRRGEQGEFDRLSALYARRKAEHVTAVHGERVAERRAVRAAVRAQVAQEAPKRWRLPRGFGVSPLAAQRARSGVRPREEPVRPARGLRPWRQGSPMQERIWRP